MFHCYNTGISLITCSIRFGFQLENVASLRRECLLIRSLFLDLALIKGYANIPYLVCCFGSEMIKSLR